MEENFDSTTEATETPASEDMQTSVKDVGQQIQQSDLTDLSKLEKFKFEGKDWTYQDLKKAYMLQSDYTKKTQEVAQERKYVKALEYDLPALRANPGLADEFRKVYPKQYHYLVDHIVGNTAAKPQAAQTEANPLEAKVSKLESILNSWQQETYQKQVAAYEAEIDSHLTKAHQAYKEVLTNDKAKEIFDSMVIQRAQLLKESGQITSFDAKAWGQITKNVADDLKAVWGDKQSAVFNKQKAASVRGKDVPVGGGVPAQAPDRPKTLRDATAAAQRHFENLGR